MGHYNKANTRIGGAVTRLLPGGYRGSTSPFSYLATALGQMQLVVYFVGAPPGLAVAYHCDIFAVFYTPFEVAAGGPVVASGV